ncbi:MAG: threonylcarbamoyl-AMP synthase [Rhodocyclaceae bacterium]|nr:threonylcarbamoyl-AMP synthase [Rhodocyclaceae bacterium]
MRPSLDEAIAIVRAGGVVAMPTETVYGLAADARNADAVAKVFALKERPLDHPLIVHLASAADIGLWAASVPETARRFAEAAWPGPLTLVLAACDDVPRQITGGQDTVALRVPDHALALQLIQGAGGALVAPSANRFGRLSPSRPEHVLEGFGDAPPPVLDGGPCRVGIESTVVFVDDAGWQVLRPGHWTAEALARIAGAPPRAAGSAAPRTPGQLASHYAPRTPLLLFADRAALCAAANEEDAVLLLGERARPDNEGDGRLTVPPPRCIALPADPQAAATALYDLLHQLDAAGARYILAELPPDTPAWQAVRDRLTRAATPA